jgi:hypothetical protein
MKINEKFLYMIDGELVSPLTIAGDDGTLTLTKGDKYEEWQRMLALHDKVNGPCGAESMTVANRSKMLEVIGTWLDGVEFKG